MGTNLKFYEDNKLTDLCTYGFTSANESVSQFLYDRDPTTKIISVGSDDDTDEVFQVTFPSPVLIDTIFVLGHNIKLGTLRYGTSDDIDFSPILNWSGNATPNTMFSFTPTTVSKLFLRLQDAMIEDAQKFVSNFVATKLIGEVQKNPSKLDFGYKDAKIVGQTYTGGSYTALFGRKASIKASFTDASDTDVSLFRTIHDLGDPVFVQMNGGVNSYTQDGFRTQDIFLMNWVNDFEPKLKSDMIGIGALIDVEMKEV